MINTLAYNKTVLITVVKRFYSSTFLIFSVLVISVLTILKKYKTSVEVIDNRKHTSLEQYILIINTFLIIVGKILAYHALYVNIFTVVINTRVL
jgi:hypothetical protein